MTPGRIRALASARLPVAVLAALLGVGVGWLIPLFPPLGLLGLVGVALAILVVFRQALPRFFLGALAVLLAGYAFFGKGFAYLGLAPLYVGELVLALAAATIVVSLGRARLTRLHGLLLIFMLWGLLRTLPYLSLHGLDALRDAVLWLYALFALAVSFAVSRVDLERLAARYRKLLPFFIGWVPIAGLLTFALGAAIPHTPGSNVPFVAFKGGDVGVHLAGAAAFLLSGLFVANPSQLRTLGETLLWPGWLAALGIAGAVNRGGLLSASLGVLATIALRPSRRSLRFVWVSLLVLSLLVLVNPTVSTGRGRELSVRQLANNVLSLAGRSSEGDLNATKEWRLLWWEEIIDYTVKGPYFWTGKGFGINLADDDGFQVEADGSLRSPHNGHLTILARMGVPGLVLWVGFNLAFGLTLLRAARRAHRQGWTFWAAIDIWLLVYWLAMLLNASVDVYLEGPQGGIWFWSIVGFGLAAITIQRQDEVGASDGAAAGPVAATAIQGQA